MNGLERLLAHLEGRPVDRLPLMPVTMQFAGDRAGARYIVGAGCEVCRDTPEANVRTLAAYAREHRPGSP